MNKRQAPKGKSLTLLLIAVGAAIGLVVAIPFFLSHARPAPPPVQPSAAAEVTPTVSVLGGKLVFRDAKAQAREFIGYDHSIKLTPEQEAIKKATLEPMPAACCRNSSAYTCCCPCNLSKSLWGLSNYAIARQHATAAELRTVVDAWLAYANPGGLRGTACYEGRCEEKPSKDGCGGMNESDLNV